MALRFFADHCVSNLVIESLQQAGHLLLRLNPDPEVGFARGFLGRAFLS
jgi:hypothetical protein